jgi:hypothetical protein
VWRYRAGDLTVTANFTDKPVAFDWLPGGVLLSTAAVSPGSFPRAGTASERNRAHPATLEPWEGLISVPTR